MNPAQIEEMIRSDDAALRTRGVILRFLGHGDVAEANRLVDAFGEAGLWVVIQAELAEYIGDLKHLAGIPGGVEVPRQVVLP